MDTADTGNEDAGFQHYWDDEHDHQSAAEIANESGGISCNSLGAQTTLQSCNCGIIFSIFTSVG